ncbi:MAG: carbon storage regulator CsrA [bacterium]
MLVLTRKLEESVMIGDNIEIKVISVHGETIKLGITAPRNIPVHRKEVYEEIERENILAASMGTQIEKMDILEHIFKDKEKLEAARKKEKENKNTEESS